MTSLELTSEQKHKISVELNASDFYETVPFLNHVLKVLGYVDYMEDDREREELRWTKRKEPLIEDEKIRKAVRAWADAEEIGVVCYKVPDTFESIDGASKIEFCVFGFEEGQYTIAELCGEEDE